MVGWVYRLAGWLGVSVCRSVGCIGWLVGWVYRLVGWLGVSVGWSVGCISWLVGWVYRLVGRLGVSVGWSVGCVGWSAGSPGAVWRRPVKFSRVQTGSPTTPHTPHTPFAHAGPSSCALQRETWIWAEPRAGAGMGHGPRTLDPTRADPNSKPQGSRGVGGTGGRTLHGQILTASPKVVEGLGGPAAGS